MENKSILEKLMKIQSELKVNKDLYNSFGGFYYRNVESIYNAFKPLGMKYNCMLMMNDDIVQIGDRYYVKATATIYDCETGESLSANSFARETTDKKGSDVAMITGAASSYARKYACGALLLTDDNKDVDTNEYSEAVIQKEDVEEPVKFETPESPKRTMINQVPSGKVQRRTIASFDD